MKKHIRAVNKLNNLRSRFFSMLSISLILCTVFFTILQFVFMDNIYTSAAKTDMIKASKQISEIDFSSSDYKRQLSDIEAQYNIYLEIYKPRDNLIYTTKSNDTVYEHEAEKSDSDELKPRIMKILSHVDNSDGSYYEERQEYYAEAKYIVYGSYADNLGLDIYSSVDVINGTAKTASITLFAISLFILSVFIISNLIYAVSYTNPLLKINNVTKKIAQMDFSETCPSFRIHDLNELSKNINTLSFSLDHALKDLQEKNKQLEDDIDKRRRLEKTRRSFIANASHELKTPISIIQGYAEGMKLGIGCDTPDEYCDIIIEEAEKMNNLVVRLLELTQYDSGMYNLNCENFVIFDKMYESISSRLRFIEEKQIDFHFDINSKYIGYGDAELLGNVLNNYISNAISHIDSSKQLYIVCSEVEGAYRISIFNSGKPIQKNDIDNIWHSFYRADKAHSRSAGRFGLGLSIVAALQDLHKQKYGVINHEHGVEFWFDIKKADNIDR